MKFRSRIAIITLASLGVSALAVVPAGAQREGRAQLVLTAFKRGGGLVNEVIGPVTVVRQDSEYELGRKVRLERDDVVRVGAGGRAEVLLNPGYFVRLGERTDVRCLDLATTNLKLALYRGSLAVEIAKIDPFSVPGGDVVEGIYDLVTIVTQRGNVVLTQGGTYRVDAAPDGPTAVRVTDGSADVVGATVERGWRAKVTGTGASTERFDPRAASVDELDRWNDEQSRRAFDGNRALDAGAFYHDPQGRTYGVFVLEDPTSAHVAASMKLIAAGGDRFAFAEPGVDVRHADGPWTPATTDAAFAAGDRLKTGKASRAAVELFPNCKLFVAWDSEVTYLRKENGRATVEVARGSAEVVSGVDAQLVTLVAKGHAVDQLRAGSYRVDVSPDGHSELRVRRGRARAGTVDVGGDDRLSLDDPAARPRSLRHERDGFDVWCRQASVGLEKRANLIAVLQRNRAKLAGLWYEISGGYAFVPTGWEYRSATGKKFPVRFWAGL